ncbi:hypothetical protein [Clostridium estertheticum]|uniref:hypothetical protein n=1 Tax=Clostridium estertheticum TaxID=238834 RepID=UPI001CF2FFA9|nr:hypothetical protein [Clostridium estertheticum]MCB2339590.1 hypothetical protein [Clostridium estertheticum]
MENNSNGSIISKTLIITQTVQNDYAYLEWISNGYNADITLRNIPMFARLIRRYYIKYNLPFQSFWYGDWKKELYKYNTIILHSSSLTMKIPKWIKRKNGKMRVILWYWNPVNKYTLPTKVDRKYCELWSFDIENCKKYNMKLNTQYYFKSMKLPNAIVDNDLFYIGSDKGRIAKIYNVYEQCINQGISIDFNVVPTDSKKIKYKEIVSKKMDYQDIIAHIAKSKAILEINQEGQTGLTLRALESIFHSKKLITNNQSIVNYDLYNNNNIFIIGVDKWENLKKFINIKYEVLSKDIINKYDFNNWFKNFFEWR